MSAYQTESAGCVGVVLRVACGLALGCLAACPGCQPESKTAQSRPITGWQAPQQSKVGALRPRPEPKLLPVTHFASAQLLESGGDLEGAARQYRLAIALNHDFVAAYERLGQLLDRIGHYADAERVWREAIARAPEVASLRNDFGFHYLLQRRYSEAALYFDSALMVDPTFRRARINLGITLAQVGQVDEALEQFREALPEAHAQYNLGLVLRQNNRVPKAAGAFRAALGADPNMLAARLQLTQLEPILDEIGRRRARLAVAESEQVPETITMPELSKSAPPAAVPQEPGLLPFLNEWASLYRDYENCVPKEWELLTPTDQINYSQAVEEPAYDTAEARPLDRTPDAPAGQAVSKTPDPAPKLRLPEWLRRPDRLVVRSVELLSRHISPGDLLVQAPVQAAPMVPALPSISQARTWVDFDTVEDPQPIAWNSPRFAIADPDLERIEQSRRISTRLMAAIEDNRILDGYAVPAGAVMGNHNVETVHPWNLTMHLPFVRPGETTENQLDSPEEPNRLGQWVGRPPEMDELIAPSPRSYLIPWPTR